MRPFAPAMFRHRVALCKQVETTGRAGGVVEAFPAATVAPLPCRVRFAGDREGMIADGETTTVLAQVAFPADPGAALGDQIEFGARKLRVLASAKPRDADGVLWVVPCQVIE